MRFATSAGEAASSRLPAAPTVHSECWNSRSAALSCGELGDLLETRQAGIPCAALTKNYFKLFIAANKPPFWAQGGKK